MRGGGEAGLDRCVRVRPLLRRRRRMLVHEQGAAEVWNSRYNTIGCVDAASSPVRREVPTVTEAEVSAERPGVEPAPREETAPTIRSRVSKTVARARVLQDVGALRRGLPRPCGPWQWQHHQEGAHVEEPPSGVLPHSEQRKRAVPRRR
jgi:hypothetical protein